MARVAFLWHLHQPDYRDPGVGRPILPFVRLHALRGYRDLVVETLARDTPWTLNLVPSLLDQLDEAAAGVRDPTWDLQREDEPPPDLAAHALPTGHDGMWRAWPDAWRLRRKAEAGDRLSPSELLDLQVWSVLAWFGATAVRDFPALRALRAKGRGFSADDRAAVLAVHDAVLRELPGLLRRLPPDRVSCSPYYHPILPLLVDADHARRALPDLPPVAFRRPGDALRQLTDARARLAGIVGAPPIGLWPSEGSVSPEVVALAAEAGFRWLCSDRGVLSRSVREGRGEGPWALGHGVVGLFRDTDLSDRIGFRYAGRPGPDAAADFVGALAGREGTVLVALDGENPWESYPDAGAAFRDALCARLPPAGSGRDGLVTVDAAAGDPPAGRVAHLWTGSWIGADFRIWIGHEEDRAGWRLLADARAAADRVGGAARERALAHLLAAEGSDWFWWFGDEFRTPFARDFDALFRAHVRAAWRALGLPVPDAVDAPIASGAPPEHAPPTRTVTVSPSDPASWLAWAGAGEIRVAEGAMAGAAAVRTVRYGWDGEGRLWLRVEGRGRWLPDFPAESFVDPRGVTARPTSDEPLVWRAGDQVWPDPPLVLPPRVAPWGR